ncbi:MAG: hypothetical protein IKE24_01400 [Clostridia bacterium]|nr:hypothetical protein [Clostridia bacterium]
MNTEVTFRPMEYGDAMSVFPMMQEFYDRQLGAGKYADDLLWRTIERCVGDYPYIQGWLMTDALSVLGYAIVSFGYDTAAGQTYVRLEELYVLPLYREADPGSAFLRALPGLYPEALYACVPAGSRREAAVYRRCGYKKEALLLST